MAESDAADTRGQATPLLRLMLICMAIALVVLEPAPLYSIARAYAALCERYPALAFVANHVPPLPLALLLSLIGATYLAGVGTGIARLLATRRFKCQLHRDSKPIPAYVSHIVDDLGLYERVTVVGWPQPMACCYGFFRPRIAVTIGLIERLDDEELAAVLGHEREHLRRRDPLRYLVLDTLSASAFMVPVISALGQRWRTRTELIADRAALAVASPGALAGALLAVIRSAQLPPGIAGLTATEARIAQLGGETILPSIPVQAVTASLGFVAATVLAMIALTASADLVRMACPLCPWLP
jgi:Zn-dependent protease with chaperone function